MNLELLLNLGGLIGIGGLLLWLLQRQSKLLETTTELKCSVDFMHEKVEKLDGFRERLALVEAKSTAAHARMDAQSHH